MFENLIIKSVSIVLSYDLCEPDPPDRNVLIKLGDYILDIFLNFGKG